MELPRRPRGDEQLKPGELRHLIQRLRRLAPQHDLAMVKNESVLVVTDRDEENARNPLRGRKGHRTALGIYLFFFSFFFFRLSF